MEEQKVAQLPVADDQTYLGLVREVELLEADEEDEVQTHIQHQLDHAFVPESAHLFDVFRVASRQQLDVVPVLGADHSYLGVADIRSLLTAMSELLGVQSEGSMLVLNIPPHSYSPGQIARIAESAGATLESLMLTRGEEGQTQVTIKVNIQDLQSLAASYERFGYTVAASFHHHTPGSVYERNYQALMRFLEV